MMENIILEEFSIHGLNQEYDVDLKFIDNKKILVSENGSGKTTILRILYLFLKQDYKIFNYDFDLIKIKINGIYFFYPKELLKVILNNEVMNELTYIEKGVIAKFISKVSKIGEYDLADIVTIFILHFCGVESNSPTKINKELIKLFFYTKKSMEDKFHIFNMQPIEFDLKSLKKSINLLFKNCENTQINDLLSTIEFLKKNKNTLNKFDDIDILYFPTFRMIEDNISYFKSSDDDFSYPDFSEAEEFFKNNELIKFGTKDIKDTWQYLTNRIRASTTVGFLEMSASLLSDILNERTINQSEISTLSENIETIEKVISRLDKSILSETDKKKLIKTIQDKSIDKNKVLVYSIENILKIYNKEKILDETIASYCKVINMFFKNKQIVFDDKTSEIYVNKLTTHNKNIDVEKLSSGEKQILLFFTKLFLANFTNESNINKKIWIIYDEPEISLSIEWQQILIPEIISSGKCDFLFCATHSPFIFKNEYKKYANDLSLEIKELNS